MSGVRLSGRLGLQNLLKEVQGGAVSFQHILVLDVSRWGRFQDVDESAYYEFLCKRSAVAVHYCAEPFGDGDGDSASIALFKALKRSMAGEYSRELSGKVFAGQARLSELGFHTGGPAGFGLRRQVVDCDGNPKGILRPRERKYLLTDRVILVPGPDEEVRIVREIFDLFTAQPISERQIARILNARGIKTDRGGDWQKWSVPNLLINPKYTGCKVYGRTSSKLGTKRVRNPKESWIRRDGAFQSIVTRSQFELVQQVIRTKAARISNERLLDSLRDLLRREGALSTRIIRNDDKTLDVQTYIDRFHGLSTAYELIGYNGKFNRHGAVKIKLKEKLAELCETTKSALLSLGATVDELGSGSYWRINSEFTLEIIVCYCSRSRDKSRWQINSPGSKQADVVIVARMDRPNQKIIDYFVLPHTDRPRKRRSVGVEPCISMDAFRFDNLDLFFNLTRRCSLLQPFEVDDGIPLRLLQTTTEPTVTVQPEGSGQVHTPMEKTLFEKATIVREMLVQLEAMWRKLCRDRNFTTLLRAESLLLVPEALSGRERHQHRRDDTVPFRNSYGVDVLNFSVISCYIERMMANAEVDRYLKRNHVSLGIELKGLAS